jgi:hypothetical protein
MIRRKFTILAALTLTYILIGEWCKHLRRAQVVSHQGNAGPKQ